MRRGPADRWGAPAQLLHWTIVVLIVAMAWLGLTMVDMPNTPAKVERYALHKSLGLLVLALVAVRLLWRVYAGAPEPLPAPRWQRWLAQGTHFGLYLLLLAMPLSGWLYDSASGLRPFRWFGLFTMPKLAAPDEALADRAHELHEWLFWVLVAAVALHAAAAFHHHLFRNDATLLRMLPRWRRSPP